MRFQKAERAKNIYWGIVLIAVAVLAILSSVGVNIGFVGDIAIINLAVCLIAASMLVYSLVKKNFRALPFELGLIFLMLEDSIAKWVGREGQDLIGTWVVILCAIAISVGFSLIFGGKAKKCVAGRNKSFASQTKYIDCTDFDYYYQSIKMGDVSINFENTENYNGNGVLEVECKMGNMTINVPASWHTTVDVKSNMSNIEEEGTRSESGPALTVKGVCKMGNINIRYI